MSNVRSNVASAQAEGALHAGRGVLKIGLGKAAFMLLGFAQRWLLARVVGPDALGAFALVNNTVSVLNNTVVQSTVQAVSKFTAEADARILPVRRAGLRLQCVLAPLLALTFFLGAPLLAQLGGAPDYYHKWFRLAAFVPLFYGFYAVFIGSVNGQRRFGVQAAFDATFALLKTVLLLGGALVLAGRRETEAGGEGLGPVTGALLGFVAAAAIILGAAVRIIGTDRGAGALASGVEIFPVRRLVSFMLGLTAYALLTNLALNYDLFWLRRFAGQSVAAQPADVLAGQYEALRTIALLPHQALLVVTFVMFPLVSRSTFESARDTTRAYVSQALRVSFMCAGAMVLVLAARPEVLLGLLYPPEYQAGAAALPLLLAAEAAFALTSIACAMINAAGHPGAAIAVMVLAVAVGSGAAFTLTGRASPGFAMLHAQALATAFGMGTGLIAALGYLRLRFCAGVPALSVLRTGSAFGLALVLVRGLPAHGVVGAALAAGAGLLAYAGLLVLGGELGPRERALLVQLVGRIRHGEGGKGSNPRQN